MTAKLFSDKKLIIYTDGGARGNPGPAGIARIKDRKTAMKIVRELIEVLNR